MRLQQFLVEKNLAVLERQHYSPAWLCVIIFNKNVFYCIWAEVFKHPVTYKNTDKAVKDFDIIFYPFKGIK